MNKNIITALLIGIPLIIIGLLIPTAVKQYNINKLTNTRDQLSGMIAQYSGMIKELGAKHDACNNDMPKWHDDANSYRTEIEILINQIGGIDYELGQLVGVEINTNDIDTTDIEERLAEGELLGHKYIVIHHTATKADATWQTIEKNFIRKYGRAAAHIVIQADGYYEYIYDLDKNAGSTENNGINNYAIQIELVGNFDEHKPTLEQYKTLKKMINLIEKEYGKQEIVAHKEVGKTSCPGSLIDMEWISTTLRDFDFSGYIEFNLTKYYSPEEGQDKYFSSIPGYFSQEYMDRFSKYNSGYEMDVCMNCGCDLNVGTPKKLYDCTVPADGLKLNAEEAMTVVACPQTYELGTKIHIEGLGDVICRDRGGAITENRIDVWMGYGQTAQDNWDKVIAGNQIGYIVEYK